MKIFRLEQNQILPITLEQAWEFFSDPRNLRRLTPSDLDFRITNEPGARMHAGQIITYTVRPLLGWRMRWVSEITHCEAPHAFIDVQRFGPYRMWHHRHTFRTVPGGVEAADDIHYALPAGLPAPLLNRWLVAPQLKRIFDYRRDTLGQLFPSAVHHSRESRRSV